jgi:AmmeMemoRadiSam system protein B
MVRKPAWAVKIRLADSQAVDTIGRMETRVREPVVAGTFYPGRCDALAAIVEDLLGEDVDRRCAPLSAACGLIVPHAGYPYSGATAAAGYGAVAAQGRPDIVVLLGANHTGSGGAISLDDHDAWRTPLGDVPVARDVVARLSGEGLAINTAAFAREHSIEVQLPFLQILWGSTVPIVPICVQLADRQTLAEVGEVIADALGKDRHGLIIASSDFTHYEPDETARRIDHLAVEPILALDAPRFFSLCVDNRLSICGVGAISVLIAVATRLSLTDTSLVDYATSGDTTGDRSAVVGYAAISFVRRNHG